MNRNDWLKMEDITAKECNELLDRIHNKLVDMEAKNDWDAVVNEVGFQSFLYQSFYFMLDEIEKDLGDDIEKYQWYPKINQFWHYADYIDDVHCTVKEAAQDFEGKTKIFEFIEEWWRFWF